MRLLQIFDLGIKVFNARLHLRPLLLEPCALQLLPLVILNLFSFNINLLILLSDHIVEVLLHPFPLVTPLLRCIPVGILECLQLGV